jgi:hypothetical protein
MNRNGVRIAWAAGFFMALRLWSQDPKQALQQRLAEMKQSIAQNQARLKAYQWVETTEVSLKGDVKKREQKQCRYSADGTVQKTPIGAPPEPKKEPRGLKGRIVEKKVDELKDYMDRFGSLIHRYVPPNPSSLQAAQQAGKASLDRDGALASLIFSDYAKPGDKVTFTFDTAAKKLRSFDVATYLDGPEDVVSLNANLSSLPDGINFVEQVDLKSTKKQLEIKTTNFDYKKIGQ